MTAPTNSAPTTPTPDLAALLQTLAEDSAGKTSQPKQAVRQLAEARLGVASGLFAAMRSKHEATAMHCLRVSLGCSAWSLLMEMSRDQRDALEVAALLHDVGKIGVPDAVLLKPGKLLEDEQATMEFQKVTSQQILAACCSSAEVLEIVHYGASWYDGSRGDADLVGDDLPIGARMLTIVDAFDSMTTDHVYRRAMPRERAIAELYAGAGTQFDPNLVEEFCSLTETERMRLDESVGSRWLNELKPTNAIWAPGPQLGAAARDSDIFHSRMLQAMHDAVVFVDNFGRVECWNNAAERLTGVPGNAVVGQLWTPDLVELWDDAEQPVAEEECPVGLSIKSGVQAMERGSIVDRNSQRRGVNLHIIPVWDQEGCSLGAVLMIRDASNEITLEEKVQNLHEKATLDPLTKVGNRAEFDRVHTEIIDTHQASRSVCSLIICDIDHFKRVNDNYGHQAGDEVLQSFAKVLQSFTRSGDLVARYGGEEFVLLCANCDNVDATRRAEDIRSRLSTLPQPMLNNMCITASFGVTGLQSGDTPETMLARADRALLEAKESGRNRVVQIGSGLAVEEPKAEEQRSSWLSFLDVGGDFHLEKAMHTPVPMDLAVEKLRGFVADHRAGIVNISEGEVCLNIDSRHLPNRRSEDRVVAFVIDVRLNSDERVGSGTTIHVRIRPRRRRDRRLKDIESRALQLVRSLRAYFMAEEVEVSELAKSNGLFRD